MILPHFTDNPFQIRLSFHKIIEQLEAQATGGNDLPTDRLLREIAAHPELRQGITDVGQIENNAALISDLLSGLFPPALTDNEIKAVSIPYQGLMFNYSRRFKKILNAAGEDFKINIRNFDDQQFYIFSCCLILNQFYGTHVDFSKPLFFDIPTAGGYIKHYRILYNADYIEIIPLKPAPTLSATDIEELLNNYDRPELWKERFPKESWLMKGFALITLVDVTIENAVSLLKGDLLGNGDDPELHLKMASVFRSIFQLPEVQVGFTSLDELNGKFRNISFGPKIQSLLLTGEDPGPAGRIFEKSMESWMKNQTYYAVADVSALNHDHVDLVVKTNLGRLQIASLIIAPVVKNGAFLGFLELASPRRNDFNSVNANKLENVMPFLIDTIDRKVTEFKNRIQAVIQNNYTTLHASVNWKFEREAHQFIRTIEAGLGYSLQEIRFQDVYPLYGEVDVQNSSVTHNLSIRQDLEKQTVDLLAILKELALINRTEETNTLADRLTQIAESLRIDLKADAEQQIEYFLENEIHPLLISRRQLSLDLTLVIDNYFRKAKMPDGEYHLHRRNYEKTIDVINGKLIHIIDKRHEEIQRYFPHYYERFKTDGVEHNLYIGESIYPGHQFGPAMLERLRIWQLLATAEMEITQRQIKNELPYPLGLTSLILVFSTPINIRFRMDEKHFDLDGANDVKYEVIKKRIDKAHIKGTSDRITAKEKLTIVFMKDEEKRIYQKYVQILQARGILNKDIEEFEVEDLQGVAGLTALRVGIISDLTVIPQFDQLYELVYEEVEKYAHGVRI